MTQETEKTEPKGPSPEQRSDQSRRDRTDAALRKELQEAQKRSTQAEAELEETKATLTLLRDQSQWGEDEEKRAKALAKREQELTAREKVAAQAEKRASARLLHSQYGMPLDDLLEYDDPRDMEIAALKYEKSESLKAKPAAKPEEEESKPAKVDTGSATRTAPNWADYNLNTKEGREAFNKAEADETARRKRAQRATA